MYTYQVYSPHQKNYFKMKLSLLNMLLLIAGTTLALAATPPYTPQNPPAWDHTGVLEAIRFDGVRRTYITASSQNTPMYGDGDNPV